MRFFIASDIHGSAAWCRRFIDAVERECPDRVLLLGDVLYHGPRNSLPDGYNPKEVIAMLNPLAQRIVAVRGNCDAEVDQMVLDFPCMADYTTIFDAPSATTHGESQAADSPDSSSSAARTLFLTHGHIFGPGIDGAIENLPNAPTGSALLYGHTHKKVNGPCAQNPALWLFNPGSLSLPKDGSHSYGVYTSGLPIDQAFQHVLLN